MSKAITELLGAFPRVAAIFDRMDQIRRAQQAPATEIQMQEVAPNTFAPVPQTERQRANTAHTMREVFADLQRTIKKPER